jgi:hypothetical protein
MSRAYKLRPESSSYLSKERKMTEALNKVKLEAGVESGREAGSCIFLYQNMFLQG